MFLLLLAFAALTHPVLSQDGSGLPTCAQTCAAGSIGATGCVPTDSHCICTSSIFFAQFGTCISTACSPSDQAAAVNFTESFCSRNGVTIMMPGCAVQ
ncbi:hypothetical protein DM02DRAFT_544728 [Periconia macrospinosa]|uniref:CFEM domain-containing protein n=1 Tax=Periconia macrospinosa TaxID=97972 RepID=A0A2V1D402_9PLEO|nr:hypothetical protein DM02DRAFT_544728 [Periconia macrospinosa]